MSDSMLTALLPTGYQFVCYVMFMSETMVCVVLSLICAIVLPLCFHYWFFSLVVS